jgi:hydrogenase nickel incorporation protein HypA/HybF
MHELTLCFNLIRILEQTANSATPPIIRIKTVWLEIGELAGIDIDAIRFSFPIAATHSLAKDATLKIKTQAGQALCHNCHKNVTLSSLLAPCSICGQYNYTITQGKALRIIRIAVDS